ncbi:RcnB family protein [Cobetia sp. L2A1]|uniref:RcnB family protein n=1 Tax=Cobetia sp. L2A1 TaxID=2686360 RepID=UPI00131CF07B|nr:RcnB family protein [Cobetia sp. L2A1]
MRHRTLTVLTMIFALMTTPLAQAGPHDRDDRGDRGHHQQDRKHQQKQQKHQRQQQKHQRQQQKHHEQRRREQSSRSHHWQRGDHVPRDYYANKRYWVSDWHGHHLSKPPRGHRWLNIDGRYVLAAVAGGAITAIILNR